MIIFLFLSNTNNGEIMKIIKTFSKIILIIATLIIMSSIIINIVIFNNYKNIKTCRKIDTFIIENYQNIDNVSSLKVIDECDKIIIYVQVDDTINHDNIKAVILKFLNLKIKYNDDSIFELIIINDNLNYLVIIDEEERIDIDFEN